MCAYVEINCGSSIIVESSPQCQKLLKMHKRCFIFILTIFSFMSPFVRLASATESCMFQPSPPVSLRSQSDLRANLNNNRARPSKSFSRESITVPHGLQDGTALRWTPAAKIEHATVMLDLDKTCIYGNDGNDLPMALQWADASADLVCDLYRLLLSPYIKPAVQDIMDSAYRTSIAIYTRRPQTIHYHSNVRRETIDLRFHPEWHTPDGQLLLPGYIASAEEAMAHYSGLTLLDDEAQDVTKLLERLIAARDAVTQELGLSRPPTVVVTAEDKDVVKTARQLGVPDQHAVLFDDNQGLAHDPHVVTVVPLETLPKLQRLRVLEFMERHAPAENMCSALREFLLGAEEGERAITVDRRGRVAWHIPETAEGAGASWRNPSSMVRGAPKRAHRRELPAWAERHFTAARRRPVTFAL